MGTATHSLSRRPRYAVSAMTRMSMSRAPMACVRSWPWVGRLTALTEACMTDCLPAALARSFRIRARDRLWKKYDGEVKANLVKP